MLVDLRPVERDDLVALFRMRVTDEQRDFVMHNAVTLAQAAYEPNAFVFGIWANDVPVGMTALIDMRGYPFIGDGDDQNTAYIWRLMIDADHQRQGYGRAALCQISDWATKRGLPRLMIATAQTNVGALHLYRSVGYRPTGRVVCGEMELSMTILPAVKLRWSA